MEVLISRANPIHPDTVLFYFSVDGFREVNEAFGHETGD